MRVVPVALVATLLAVGAAQAFVLADQGAPCPGFRYVSGQGPSCPLADGWEVLLPDGSRLRTHGPDALVLGLADPAPLAAVAHPRCIDLPTEFATLVIYAHPLDRPDRYTEIAPALREAALHMNGLLRAEAAEHGVRLDYRMRCDGGEVRVAHARVPLPAAQVDFSTLTSALKGLGYASPMEKYVVWYDDPGIVARCGCAGQGELWPDATMHPQNQNNVGPSFGVTYGVLGAWLPLVMMHEHGHNLGAVSNRAPDTSGANHCNDGYDIMCYADGGPQSAYTTTACPDRTRFDCGRDTYFHPAPSPTSWLGRNWNLGGPLNRFFEGCMKATEPSTAALPATFDLPADCDGHRYAAFGATHLDTYTTCWYAGGTLLSCDDGNAKLRASVPPGATRAVVTPLAARSGVVSFSVV